MKRTLTEGRLAALARKASLSLWSYPSPFRNQGNAGGGDGKEVADVLLVFGQHIVIFSDKACDYPAIADRDVAWARWFRAAIFGAGKQLRGAMRWIRKDPSRIFADKACSRPLAVDLASIRDPVFHLVAVVHDKTGRRARLTGGSGSLVIDPEAVGANRPLHVGRIGQDWPFVHVWDEATFHVILGHLDTVPDLVDYLSQRAALSESGRLMLAAGEEDLLALFLTNVDERGDHVFPGGSSTIVVGPNAWHQFSSSQTYKAYKSANQVSYVWDDLIDKTIGHAIAGTSTFDSTGGNAREMEWGFRAMASERRVARRSLCYALVQALQLQSGSRDLFRTIPALSSTGTSYVFLVCPRRGKELEKGYRERRGKMLLRRLEWSVAKGLVPERQPVVGIAVDAGAHRKGAGYSEDIIGMQFDEVDEAWRVEMLQFGKTVGWGKKFATKQFRTMEYPTMPDRRAKEGKVGRNERCPCGSNLKFKRCCGKA